MAKDDTKLPHAIEAERSLLGSLLREAEQLTIVSEAVPLSTDHFYINLHGEIFGAILDLDQKGIVADMVSVYEWLKVNCKPEDVPPLSYLAELLESSSVADNVTSHGKIIHEQFLKRRVFLICQEVMEQAVKGQDEAGALVESLEREFLNLSNANDQGDGLVSGTVVVDEAIDEIQRRIELEGQITGVTSGFDALDLFTGGWQKSDLIILAARPAMGKTALALNFAVNAAKAEKTVLVFSLEMPRTQLMERLIASKGRVDSSKIRKGDLGDKEIDMLMWGARTMQSMGERIYIDDTSSLSLMDLRSRVRRFKKENGDLDLIVIDYLQLMQGSAASRKEGREREVSEISAGLKGLAKEMSVPIIALAQLNRGPDNRPDHRPKVSDLRESGSVEQDADQIMFVYRDEYYNENSEFAGQAEVIIGKNRHGEIGKAVLAYLPNFVSFENLQKE